MEDWARSVMEQTFAITFEERTVSGKRIIPDHVALSPACSEQQDMEELMAVDYGWRRGH